MGQQRQPHQNERKTTILKDGAIHFGSINHKNMNNNLLSFCDRSVSCPISHFTAHLLFYFHRSKTIGTIGCMCRRAIRKLVKDKAHSLLPSRNNFLSALVLMLHFSSFRGCYLLCHSHSWTNQNGTNLWIICSKVIVSFVEPFRL